VSGNFKISREILQKTRICFPTTAKKIVITRIPFPTILTICVLKEKIRREISRRIFGTAGRNVNLCKEGKECMLPARHMDYWL
jgi:hypothetical protein